MSSKRLNTITLLYCSEEKENELVQTHRRIQNVAQ